MTRLEGLRRKEGGREGRFGVVTGAGLLMRRESGRLLRLAEIGGLAGDRAGTSVLEEEVEDEDEEGGLAWKLPETGAFIVDIIDVEPARGAEAVAESMMDLEVGIVFRRL